MSEYLAGVDPRPTKADIVINPNQIATGDYILQYKVSAITFKLLDPQTIDGVINGWVKFENLTAYSPGDQRTSIKGVYINTDTGAVDIGVNVQLIPGAATQEAAGVNYMRVLAVVVALFAALGIILVLVAVYKVVEATVGGPVAAGSIGLILGLLIALFVITYFFQKGRISFS